MDSVHLDHAGYHACLKLVVAVMMQAIDEVRGDCALTYGSLDPGTERKILQVQAISWVMSNQVHPYSYLWVCDMISVNPQHIRDAIRSGDILEWTPKTYDGLSIYRLQHAN